MLTLQLQIAQGAEESPALITRNFRFFRGMKKTCRVTVGGSAFTRLAEDRSAAEGRKECDFKWALAEWARGESSQRDRLGRQALNTPGAP